MAKLRVFWTETVSYSTEIEVDGYDPEEDVNDEESGVMEQILNLEKEEFDKAFDSVDDREVTQVEVLRDGDDAPLIVMVAPAHEEMF
jgi:hypothetical protein